MSILVTAVKPAFVRIFAVLSLLWVAACGDVQISQGENTGQRIDPNETVRVALLVPSGGNANDNTLARNLENAARMAVADLKGASIDLKVYSTQGGNANAAATATTQAIAEGAKVIVGPLYSEAAAAAGLAAAPHNVNVLSFSNTAAIAGGNVFLLGATFENTANRLVRYSTAQGANRFLVVHATDPASQFGRNAIVSAIQEQGAQLAGVEGYELSVAGIEDAGDRIAAAARSTGANALFLTGGVDTDLPVVARVLPAKGVDPANTRYVGLRPWDAAPEALSLPGLQGGYFAKPDQARINLFNNRYAAAYGGQPHALAGLAYDGVAAIGALISQGNANALTKRGLTQSKGFEGTQGVFRLLPNGLNERALAVATIRNNQVVILDPAPRSFGGSGS